MLPDIVLTAQEQSLVSQIGFDQRDFGRIDYDDWQKLQPIIYTLAKSLIGNGVVPPSRINYFYEKSYGRGGRGLSLAERWEKNGTGGEDVFRHPSFVRILRYFLFGADLPQLLKVAYGDFVYSLGPITSGDVEPLRKMARSLTRKFSLCGPVVADGFFQLCVDCGVPASYAASVEEAVKTVK